MFSKFVNLAQNICLLISEKYFWQVKSPASPILIATFQTVLWHSMAFAPQRESLPIREPGPGPRSCLALSLQHLTCSRLSISARNPENNGTSKTAMLEDPECSHLPMRTKRKNENKLRIQDNNWYMDNSWWRTTETNFRGKNIKRIYSSLKDLLRATVYLVLQNPFFCFYSTKNKHNSQRAEM